MSPSAKPAKTALPAAEKFALAALVTYQTGSVVSRTLIQDRAGTVTLFAFDEGEGLSEHSAPHHALLHMIEGAAQVIVAGHANQVDAGDVILLPAGKPHAVRASTKCKMLLTMVRSGTNR